MTVYKSATDEIIEAMAKALEESLEKDAGLPIGWEHFKKTVDGAQCCEDLKLPWRWIQTGKCVMFNDRAFSYFREKEMELKSEFGDDCNTR